MPLWKPEWAYRLVRDEPGFQLVSETDYIGTLVCFICCPRSEDAVLEPFSPSRSPNPKSRAERVPMSRRSLTRAASAIYHEAKYDVRGCCQRATRVNLFFSLHYLLHVLLRVPLYYVLLVIHLLGVITTRVFRSIFISIYRLFSKCIVCGTSLVAYLETPIEILGKVVGMMSLPIFLLYYILDILQSALLFRPLAVTGHALTIYMRNQHFEPLELDRRFRNWAEDLIKNWAWAIDSLINDPNGIEAQSAMRYPILNPRALISSMGIVMNTELMRATSEVAGPFIIQIVVIWIVYESLYVDTVEEVEDPENKVRQLAAFGAFIYYTRKAFESTSTFAEISRGHTDTLFLFLDWSTNVFLPYAVIPMAVSIVLNSSKIDIVLNLLAIDFITTIDEELYDRHVHQRVHPPYCFVFRLRKLPKRSLGCIKGQETEQVLVIDVWHRVKIKEVVGQGEAVGENEYWELDQNASMFEAKLVKCKRAQRIKELLKRSRWGESKMTRFYRSKTYGSSDVKLPSGDWEHDGREDEKSINGARRFIDPNKPHLRVTRIPYNANEGHIIRALEASASLRPLGKVLGLSYLHQEGKGVDKVHGGKKASRSRQKRQASAFFEHPEKISEVYSTYGMDDDKEPLKIKIKQKYYDIEIVPVVPFKPSKDSDSLEELKKWMEATMSRNYVKDQSSVMRNHIKMYGKEEDNSDTRVMIVWDFPFASEESVLRNAKEAWGGGAVEMKETPLAGGKAQDKPQPESKAQEEARPAEVDDGKVPSDSSEAQ